MLEVDLLPADRWKHPARLELSTTDYFKAAKYLALACLTGREQKVVDLVVACAINDRILDATSPGWQEDIDVDLDDVFRPRSRRAMA